MLAMVHQGADMLFREKLREMRDAAALTQDQLAEKAGLSVHTLRTYEYGQRLPGYGIVVRICRALGTDSRAFEDCSDFQVEKPPTPDDTRPKGKRK